MASNSPELTFFSLAPDDQVATELLQGHGTDKGLTAYFNDIRRVNLAADTLENLHLDLLVIEDEAYYMKQILEAVRACGGLRRVGICYAPTVLETLLTGGMPSPTIVTFDFLYKGSSVHQELQKSSAVTAEAALRQLMERWPSTIVIGLTNFYEHGAAKSLRDRINRRRFSVFPKSDIWPVLPAVLLDAVNRSEVLAENAALLKQTRDACQNSLLRYTPDLVPTGNLVQLAVALEPFFKYKGGNRSMLLSRLPWPGAVLLEGESGSGKSTAIDGIVAGLGTKHEFPGDCRPGRHMQDWRAPLQRFVTRVHADIPDGEVRVITSDDVAWPATKGIIDKAMQKDMLDYYERIQNSIAEAERINAKASGGKVLWVFARNDASIADEMHAPLRQRIPRYVFEFPKDMTLRRTILTARAEKMGMAFHSDVALDALIDRTAAYTGRELVGSKDGGSVGFLRWCCTKMLLQQIAAEERGAQVSLDEVMIIPADLVSEWFAGPHMTIMADKPKQLRDSACQLLAGDYAHAASLWGLYTSGQKLFGARPQDGVIVTWLRQADGSEVVAKCIEPTVEVRNSAQAEGGDRKVGLTVQARQKSTSPITTWINSFSNRNVPAAILARGWIDAHATGRVRNVPAFLRELGDWLSEDLEGIRTRLATGVGGVSLATGAIEHGDMDPLIRNIFPETPADNGVALHSRIADSVKAAAKRGRALPARGHAFDLL